MMTSRPVLHLAGALLAASCASTNSQPDGGPGTASGEVLVGEAAAHLPVNLLLDGRTVPLATDAPAGSLAFTLRRLSTGTHTLLAWADTNGDGSYSQWADLASSQISFDLDLADPSRESVEGLKLYLAQSKPGLCTLTGKVTFPSPQPYLSLGVAALDPGVLSAGMGQLSMLSQLWTGYATVTDNTRLEYRYVINNLKPATYLVVPAVSGIGGGLSTALIADLKARLQCQADETVGRDFAFGDVAIGGTVTLVPSTPTLGSFAWGVVAARSLSLSTLSEQLLLMPTLFTGTAAELKGWFGGAALRDQQSFSLRAFTSLDAASPLIDALTWGLNPLAPEPPHTVVMAVPPSVLADFTVDIRVDAGTADASADAGTAAAGTDDAGTADAGL